MTKKEIKRLKREITETSAINVGYYNDVLKHIPDYSLIDAIKEIASRGCNLSNLNETEVSDILITECVRNMNYQDFKNDVAPYFFGYNN